MSELKTAEVELEIDLVYKQRSKAKIKAFKKICKALEGLSEFDKECICRAALIVTETKQGDK